MEKLSLVSKQQETKALKLSEQLATTLNKAKKTLEASAKLKASAKAAAKNVLEDNPMHFRYTDLPDEAVKQIRHFYRFGLKKCSRCRWQTGCLSCDHEHLFPA